ncbi:MAG TPA: site-2 protease family protein [Acidimicrobiales bacterium]|nr:site-2 protease family protein [Acidimicrobiales bacterium]
MRESISLGRIGGTRVGINWSLLPIFALIAWGLASSQLPGEVSGYSTTAYWVAGVITAVAFFASLLAHELSHAALARRHGIKVQGIVLWLFGGVAQMEGDMPDARTELQVAFVGPATSLAIAGAGGVVAFALDHLGAPLIVVASVAWLAAINAMLGLFNLLPAFPLDGGRVLRALLWRHWGDRVRATNAAATAGRAIGFALIGVGAVEFFAAGGIGGVWLAMIGWFVVTAAVQQRQRTLVEDRLGDLRVADAMSASVVVVPAGATLNEVVDTYVRPTHLSVFPVGDTTGRIVGMTTVERMHAVPGERWWLTPITAAAASPAEMVTVSSGDRLAEVADRIEDSPDRAAVVIDQGRLVGVITGSDVARAISRAALLRQAMLGSQQPAAPTRA